MTTPRVPSALSLAVDDLSRVTVPGIPPRVRCEADRPTLNPDDPVSSAREFIAARWTVDGVLALRRQGGIFYGYRPDLCAYADHDEAAIRADLYRFLERAQRRTNPKGGHSARLEPFQPTKAKVENVLDATRALCHLQWSSTAPCWLDGDDTGIDPFSVVAVRNGLLDIKTRTLLRPTARFFTVNALDFPFNPSTLPPTRWIGFLHSLWPDDAEARNTLQEIFGYLLTPRTQFQKIFMLVGPKRSGKGTIGRVVRQLLGTRNVCGPTLSNLGEQFGLSTLIGKSVAIIADARISGRTDTAILSERLLSISGEDALSVPRKFLTDWSGTLTARFLLMTNELPRIEDASGALASRFIVLTLRESFYGREDHELFERFLPELPGILNWALDGYDRLNARGRFSQPQSSTELIQQLEDLGSPIGAFVRERCEVGRGYGIALDRFFDAWKLWCDDNGRDRAGTKQTLGRNLRAAVPWLKLTHPRVLGKQITHLEGLRLKEDD